jgi:hypothetical protein
MASQPDYTCRQCDKDVKINQALNKVPKHYRPGTKTVCPGSNVSPSLVFSGLKDRSQEEKTVKGDRTAYQALGTIKVHTEECRSVRTMLAKAKAEGRPDGVPASGWVSHNREFILEDIQRKPQRDCAECRRIRQARAAVEASNRPQMTDRERLVNNLMAQQFVKEWGALSPQLRAYVIADYIEAEDADPQGADAGLYRRNIGTGNLAEYAAVLEAQALRNAPKPVEEPVKVAVAVVTDGHGMSRVHNADCRDVAREANKAGNGPAYVQEFANRTELEQDWWGDVAGDEFEEGTPEWKRSVRMCADAAMEYLPCCTLPELPDFTPLSGPSMVEAAPSNQPEETAMAAATKNTRTAKKAAPKPRAQAKPEPEPMGFLSKTGIAHTEECATVKANNAGKLHYPMEGEQMDLSVLIAHIEADDPEDRWKECGLCARIRRNKAAQDESATNPSKPELRFEIVSKVLDKHAVYLRGSRKLAGYVEKAPDLGGWAFYPSGKQPSEDDVRPSKEEAGAALVAA